MTDLDIVIDSLAALASNDVGHAFLALAATGTLAMIVVQLLKEITPYRTYYQRKWFRAWLTNRNEVLTASCQSDLALNEFISRNSVDVLQCEKAIAELAAGGMSNALYSMPAEEMTAQMTLAFNIILDEPNRYSGVMVILSLHASIQDLEEILKGRETDTSAQQYFDARARVARRMERNFDGLRIALSDAWRFRMQFISIALTMIFVEMAVIISQGYITGKGFFLAALIGVAGGYLAPVTRDLLSMVQKLKIR
jgi:hypothetical protein